MQSFFRLARQSTAPRSLFEYVRMMAKQQLPAPGAVLGLPSLSPTMEKGNIADWKVKVGDKVSPGDQLAMIETDKAQVSMDAQEEGYVAKIIQPKGAQDIPVSDPIIIIVENEADIAKFKDFVPEKSGSGSAAPASSDAPSTTSASSTPQQQQPQPQEQQQTAADTSRVFASPAAKRTAAEKGISLQGVQGSGPAPNHRVILADVERLGAQPKAQAQQQQQPTQSVSQPSGAAFTDVPLTSMRKTIAARLTESKQTIPHYYLTVDVIMDEVLKVRQELNAQSKDVKLSVNDFIVKASALALRKVPTCNNSWTGSAIRVNHTVDVSVAVQTETGLITPIVRNADQRGVSDISGATKDLAERARKGGLQLNEFQGGTFTISNLGMFGVRQFTAVINPPQSCILAVGASQRRVIPAGESGDETKVANVMTVTLSCDHRVVDGAVGAQFLSAFRGLLEKPLTMLL